MYDRELLKKQIEFVLSLHKDRGLSVSQISRSLVHTGASYWTVFRTVKMFEGLHWHKLKMPQRRNVQVYTLSEQPDGPSPHQIARWVQRCLPDNPTAVVARLRRETGVMPTSTRDIIRRGEGYLWTIGIMGKNERIIIDKGVTIP